jgi:hypothetical protein
LFPAFIESSSSTASFSFTNDESLAFVNTVLGTIERHGGSGASQIVFPSHAGFSSIIGISRGVLTSFLRIFFGVGNALYLGVLLFKSSSGGEMHNLMEHCPSPLILIFLGQVVLAESDVSVGDFAFAVGRPMFPIYESCGTCTTITASSNVLSAAQYRPLSVFSKHHIHSSLEFDLHVLIFISSSFSEPPFEESGVLIPVLIGRSDDGLNSVGFSKEQSFFRFRACVYLASIYRFLTVIKLYGNETFAAYEVILQIIHHF